METEREMGIGRARRVFGVEGRVRKGLDVS